MEVIVQGLVPLSYNNKDKRKKAEYRNKIRNAFLSKYKGDVPKFPKGEELYAKVYFFTSDGVNVDCDNISKPVWDAVNDLVYVDDRQIIMRTASVIDVNIHSSNLIDTSLIDCDVAADLVQELTKENVKCLYIECSKFKESMIKIGEIDV